MLQVVAATKKELAEAGVSVAALEQAARASGHAAASSGVSRSTTVLLVKNLPSEATEDALDELFSMHGTVVRVLLPRTRALAIVEMSDEQVIPPVASFSIGMSLIFPEQLPAVRGVVTRPTFPLCGWSVSRSLLRVEV